MKVLSIALVLAALFTSCAKHPELPEGIWTAVYYPSGDLESYVTAEVLTLNISSDGSFFTDRSPFYIRHTVGHNDTKLAEKHPMGPSGKWKREASNIHFSWLDGNCTAGLLENEGTLTTTLNQMPITFHSRTKLEAEASRFRQLIVGEWETEIRGKRITTIFGADGTMKTIKNDRVTERRYSLDSTQSPLSLVAVEQTTLHLGDGGERKTDHSERQILAFVTDDILHLMEPQFDRPYGTEHIDEEVVMRRSQK